MIPAAHPDPERLAALAGDDPDATANRELTAHVADCASCDRQVHELRALRTALAELPDLAPTRPLQLIPSVAAPEARAGWVGAFRRAFAPLAVAGLVLLVVGTVGATGALGPSTQGAFLSGDNAGSPQAAEAPGAPEYGGATDQNVTPVPAPGVAGARASETPRAGAGGEVASPKEPIPSAERGGAQDRSATGRFPWLVTAVLGAGLLGAALLLRRSGA